LVPSDDEDLVPSYLDFSKKKVAKRGRTAKRSKADHPVIPPSGHTKNNVVVIDDEDDSVSFSPVTRSKTITLDSADLQAKMQDVPGFSAAMSAISQNKRLRSEIRKSASAVMEFAEEPPSASKTQDDAGVTFSVYFGANDPHPLKFICLPTEPFQKLLSAYCSYKRLDPNSAVFKWYGITLDPQQTPVDLGMTNEERLDFSQPRTQPTTNTQPAQVQDHQQASTNNTNIVPNTTSSSSYSNITSLSSSAPLPITHPGDGIVLKLRQGDTVQKFRIKKTDHVRKLLEGYCKTHNLDPNTHSLHFDGLPLALTDTPLHHDMEDGDLIDVEFV
jgi:hypothetical protein